RREKIAEHLVELENQPLQARDRLGGKDQAALAAAQAAEGPSAGRAAAAKINAEQFAKSGIDISYTGRVSGESRAETFESSAELAKEIDATRDRLQSEMENGSRSDIVSPEQDTRFAALQRGLTAHENLAKQAETLQEQETA